MYSAPFFSCSVCLLFIQYVFIVIAHEPRIEEAKYIFRTNQPTFQLKGQHLTPNLIIGTSASANDCENVREVLAVDRSPILPFQVVKIVVNISRESSSFLCLKNGTGEWINQAIRLFIPNENRTLDVSTTAISGSTQVPEKRPLPPLLEEVTKLNSRWLRSAKDSGHSRRHSEDSQPKIDVHGMRIEGAETMFDESTNVIMLLSHAQVNIRLFGDHFTDDTILAFTPKKADGDGSCQFPSAEIFQLTAVTNHSAFVEVTVPGKSAQGESYYFCLKSGNSTGFRRWWHQGEEPWLQFQVYDKLLPAWVTGIIILLLLTCSALFSGLTLGLMSLDKTDLKILCNTGTALERKYASAIMPVRSHGSLLLCSLLLGNVLVNSVLTILMDDLTSGLVAVIFSTLAIVIFGEIMPQAICSRHGLAVGAKTIYITKFVIAITAIVAWPISKILDCLLGEEIGNVYNKERLNELVKTGTDIEKDEVNIISGALQLSKKTVTSVMTKLEDVYMLSYDAILDFETVTDIMNSGYSRIPVYDGKRSSIVTLLYIKDLAFVDPDDCTPLKTLCEFYQNVCYFVFEDMTLDVLFKKFKEGTFGHMAFIQRVNSEGEGDPFYETLGLITLEDVIEELIQAEIVDETDVWIDNRSKRKREKMAKNKDFAAFAEKRENQRIHISPHLTLATFQYLSTTVEPFKSPHISEPMLQRMLQQDVYRHIKAKNKDREVVYTQGRTADYFVLILEGRVEVLVGKENMRFESGPFTYFGVQALLPQTPGESPTTNLPTSATGSLQSVNAEVVRHPFVPDYTVRPTTELIYVLIKRSLYVAALRASRLEQSKKAGEQFDDEVDKLLHIDDDDRSQAGSQSSRRTSQCEKESPMISDGWPGGEAGVASSGPNGQLPNSKSNETGDPDEKANLLDSAVS